MPFFGDYLAVGKGIYIYIKIGLHHGYLGDYEMTIYSMSCIMVVSNSQITSFIVNFDRSSCDPCLTIWGQLNTYIIIKIIIKLDSSFLISHLPYQTCYM